MKRILALGMVLLMAFSLAACGDTENNNQNEGNSTANNSNVSTNNDKNNTADTSITIDSVKNAKETDAALFEYDEVDGGVSITGFNGSDEIVVILQSIDGKSVVAIGDKAFANNETMLGVRITDSVKQIGSNAFENCKMLKVFVSGKNLEKISDFAFNNCKELSTVELNDGLKHLEMLCFGGTNMSELYIPESVETIDIPFTANKEKALKIISAPGSEAEKYVDLDGNAFNLIFEAK